MGREKKLSNEYKIGDFKVGKTIGQGAFSKVKVGYHKETGQKVAIKIIDKKLMAEKVAKSAKRKEKVKQDQETKKQEKADADQPERESKSAPTSRRSSSPPPLPPAISTNPTNRKPQPISENNETETSEQAVPEKLKVTINPPAPPAKPTPAVISPMSPMTKSANSSLMDQLYAEVKLLMRLDHPNIIGLYQVIDTESECFIIMEYAPGGELIDYIAAKDYLSEREARKFFRQILSAIDHCHRAHVVHRDLKLENLLLNSTRDILITDFGLGRTFTDDPNDLMMTFCGTPNYAAVELITFKPYVGVKTDIWAMGVILYIMCCGKPPFQGHSIPSLYNKIMNVQYTCPDYFSPNLRHLLSRMFVKDPAERASIEELYNHPWVNMDEPEPPLQVLPLYSDLNESGMEQITSINSDINFTIFTFSRYITDFMASNKKYQFNSENGEVLDGPISARRGSVFLNRRASTAARKLGGSTGATNVQVSSTDKPSTQPFARRMSAVEKGSYGSSKSSAGSGAVAPPAGSAANKLATVDENTVIANGKAVVGSPNTTAAERQRRYSYHAGTGAMPPLGVQSNGNGVGAHTRGATMNDELLGSPTSKSKHIDPFGIGQEALPNGATSPNSVSPNFNPTSPSNSFSNSTPRRMSLVPVADGILYNLPSGTSPTSPNTDPSHLHRPSDKAIQDFHLIHKPPKTIRSLRFNFTNNTTSNKPPSAIFQEVHKVLLALQQQFTKLTFHREDDYYLFTCRLPVPKVTTQTLPDPSASPVTPSSGASTGVQTEDLIFEIEVSKVWLLKMHGVRIKRISGDPLLFKDLYKDIVGRLDL